MEKTTKASSNIFVYNGKYPYKSKRKRLVKKWKKQHLKAAYFNCVPVSIPTLDCDNLSEVTINFKYSE